MSCCSSHSMHAMRQCSCMIMLIMQLHDVTGGMLLKSRAGPNRMIEKKDIRPYAYGQVWTVWPYDWPYEGSMEPLNSIFRT
jgi:hypothetical protein